MEEATLLEWVNGLPIDHRGRTEFARLKEIVEEMHSSCKDDNACDAINAEAQDIFTNYVPVVEPE